MKKAFVGFATVLFSFSTALHAESVTDTTSWKRTASGLLNLSQAYFDNWVKGGSDALNWETRLEGTAVLDRPDFTWESKARGMYGESKIASLNSRKTSDELYLETIYTRKLNAWVNPFASTSLRSQFMPGYTYTDTSRTRVSGSFDPTYVTQTLGVGYDWRKELNVRVGGTTKETFSSKRYGYAKGTGADSAATFKLEPGASLTITYQKGVMENILLNSLLDVFANFKGANQTDVRWENSITAKVNKYISTSFGFDMLYDRDLSARRQIKENLSVGISFLSI